MARPAADQDKALHRKFTDRRPSSYHEDTKDTKKVQIRTLFFFVFVVVRFSFAVEMNESSFHLRRCPIKLHIPQLTISIFRSSSCPSCLRGEACPGFIA